MLEDIAILAAKEMTVEDLGIKLENVTLNTLGRAKKARIERDNTTIIDGAGKGEDPGSRRPDQGLASPIRSRRPVASTRSPGRDLRRPAADHHRRGLPIVRRRKLLAPAKPVGGTGFGSRRPFKDNCEDPGSLRGLFAIEVLMRATRIPLQGRFL
jgi:hypothetical protein